MQIAQIYKCNLNSTNVDSLGVKLTKKITDKDGEAGTDSVYLATATVFASTKEVIQANKFE